MKFSNEEKKLAEFLFTHRDCMKLVRNETVEDDELKVFKNILVENIKDLKIIEKLSELLKYLNKYNYFLCLEKWPIPVFPINGQHLTSKNVPKGPIYSKILNSLKETWINEFNFSTSNETIDKLMLLIDNLLKN